ncbi:m7GpppX diphosphatase [Acrasis kona]|uniref:M7GpppX diphosphatase n=1 Tax=Acrasis kona TaxID=1008807 RepID=A0AAW2Z607_9EUKA
MMLYRHMVRDSSWIEREASSGKSLYHDDDIVIVLKEHHEEGDFRRLHVLTFVTTKHQNILSVRDLNESHLPLLISMYNQTTVVLMNLFHIHPKELRCFVHYVPSVFRFHLHFCCTEMIGPNMMIGRAIQFHDIINNISVKPDYYQIVNMTYSLRSDDELFYCFE